MRIGAPADLQHIYGPNAWRGSLKTSDKPTAARLAHAKLAEMHTEFERRRAELKPRTIPANAKLAEAIAEHLYRSILSDDDLNRAAGHPLAHIPLDPEDLGLTELSADLWERQEQVATAMHDYAEALASLVAMGDYGMTEDYAAMAAKEMGIPRVDWSVERVLLANVGRAMVQAYRDAAKRAQGDVIPTPPEPAKSTIAALATEAPGNTSGSGQTLRDVIPEWKARTRAKPNAIQRTEKALTLFEQAVGVLPLTALDKRVGARFLAFLMDSKVRGFGDSTAANHAAAVNALVNVAVKVDMMPKNPFDLAFEIKDAESRDAWTTEELALIFGAKEFTVPALAPVVRLVDPAAPAMVLRCLLFTGARVGELAQLATKDVQVRDGIAVMDLHRKNGTLKTDASDRYIPVAAGLETAGFLAFAEMRREAGERWLFPSLNRGGAVTPGDQFGKWFARFRETHGLPAGPLNGSHRFRHLMRSTLAGMGVGVETADALTGHAAIGSTGRTVYTAVPMSAVKAAVDRLTWPVSVPPWTAS